MDSPQSLQLPALSMIGVRRCLTCLVSLTVAGMLAVVAARAFLGRDTLMGLSQRLDPRYEGTVHAWLGSLLLAGCAALLAMIANDQRARLATHWWVLSLGFLFLSADEILQIHERLTRVSKTIFGSGSAPHLWALIGLVGAAGVLVAYLPFLRRLPPTFRRRFLIAGAVYLGGAIGVELLGGLYWTFVRPHDTYYVFLAVIEEALELVGVSMFLVALLDYVGTMSRDATA